MLTFRVEQWFVVLALHDYIALKQALLISGYIFDKSTPEYTHTSESKIGE